MAQHGLTETSRHETGGVNRVVVWGMGINLLMLLLSVRDAPWNHGLMLLPWVFLLLDEQMRQVAWQLVRSLKALVFFALILAALIHTNCVVHQCGFEDADGRLPPLVWLPFAAMIMAGRTGRLVAMSALGAAILLITGLLAWQAWVVGAPRPAGMSFNVLTGPMLLGMVCMVQALLHSDEGALPTWARQACLAITLTGLAGAVITQSRTSLLSYAIASLAFLLITPNPKRNSALLLIAIGFSWAISMTNRYEEGQREIQKLKADQYISSMGERTDGLKWSLQHVLDAPLLGKGPQQLQDQFNKRGYEWGRKQPWTPLIHHLHNDYFQLAIAHGIPALLSHLGMWACLVVHAVRRNRRSDSHQRKATFAWCLAMAGVFLPAFLTDSYTYWVYTWAAVMCCFGLSAGALASLDSTSEHPEAGLKDRQIQIRP